MVSVMFGNGIVVNESAHLCLLEQFPSQDGDDEDGDAYVRGDEVGCVPVTLEEDTEAIDQGEDDGADETDPGGVGLEGSHPGQGAARDTLDLHGFVEADVADAEGAPCDETGDRGQILQPSECLGSTAGPETEVGEGTEQPCGNHCPIGHTVRPSLAKDLRQLVVRRHGHNHSRSDPAVRITRRPSRNQNTSIDDRRQTLDPSILDGDNPRRTVRVPTTRDQIRVGGANNQPNKEGTEDIEESDAISDAVSGSGDSVMRIHRLCSSDNDSLDTDITERRIDERSQEPKEMARRSGDAVVIRPGAGIVPVAEPDGVVVGAPARGDDDGDDDQAQETKDFDTTGHDFDISVPADIEEVDGEDEDQTDGYDDGGGDV